MEVNSRVFSLLLLGLKGRPAWGHSKGRMLEICIFPITRDSIESFGTFMSKANDDMVVPSTISRWEFHISCFFWYSVQHSMYMYVLYITSGQLRFSKKVGTISKAIES